MITYLPLAFIAFLIGLGITAKPYVMKSIERAAQTRKKMIEDYLNIKTLIDNELDKDALMELWHQIHTFYRTYKYVPGARTYTAILHAHRLNTVSELFPTRYNIDINLLSELEELHPMAVQSN